MARYTQGMDPSPLLPLGVLLAVVFVVFTPLTFEVLPRFLEAAQQMLALLWLIPVVIVVAIFATASDSSYSQAQSKRVVYRYQPSTGYGEGPSWGLLGLMLLMLLLLPWRY